jgi:hypothetical protein
MPNGSQSDEGSAVVEFVFLSLVLLVPIVYLVLTLAAVQSAAFAAEAVARDASRAAVVGGVDALQDGATYARAEEAARDRAAVAVQMTLKDFHVDEQDVSVDLACSASPCLTPGSDVTVTVAVRVALPGIGALVPGAQISLRSSGASPVDGYLP